MGNGTKIILALISLIFNSSIALADYSNSEPINVNGKEQKVKINDLLYPAKSHFSQGRVEKHKISQLQKQQFTFFLIGDDKESTEWVKKNAAYLNQIHAVGFVTNIDSEERKLELERDVNFKLNVASLDGFEEVIETTHYPFLLYKGWILQ